MVGLKKVKGSPFGLNPRVGSRKASNIGLETSRVARQATDVLLGTAMIGVTAGMVRSAFP